MKLGTFGKGLALVATASLVLAACSSKSGTTDTTMAATSSASTNNTAIISTNGSEPQNPLIPSATNETGGGKIIDSIFAGLVYYDAKGAASERGRRIHRDHDSQTFTVKLKDGWTFTDGTPVPAHNFVDAWNWGADLANGDIRSTATSSSPSRASAGTSRFPRCPVSRSSTT